MTAAVVVDGDITERRRMEAEAQRRAEFEKHLIGIVSHDLRSPLSAILMSAAVLLRKGLDNRTAQGLERIHRAAERATRMVRDLLDFTQARLAGGIQIAPHPIDQIVRAHGGTISVRSIFEEGTQFEMRLPRDARRSAGPP